MTVGTAENHRDDSGYDYPLEWEAFYEVEINDSITITPAVFNIKKNGAEDVSGALGKATFKFWSIKSRNLSKVYWDKNNYGDIIQSFFFVLLSKWLYFYLASEE